MMNNHHMPAGPGQQHMNQAPPMYQQSRRQQEYHAHAYHHAPPQSPMHHPYGYPQQYYPHPGPPQHHYQPRWQPSPYQHPYMPPPPPQQAPYQPRSPVVVTSQPYAQNMTPVPRQTPMQHPPPQQPPVAQSPRPIPHHFAPQVHTPVAPPSPAPTPKQEQEQAPPPQRQEQTPPPQPPSRRQSTAFNPLASPPEHRMPFYPSLPWYSRPEDSFPPRAAGKRRRRQHMRDVRGVALPAKEEAMEEQAEDETVRAPPSEASTVAPPSEQETPATSQAPSESDATSVSTPVTPAQAKAPSPKSTPTQSQHARRDTRTAIAVPNIPGIAKPRPSPPAVDKQQPPPVSADTSATTIEAQDSVTAAPTFGDAPAVDTEGTQTTGELEERPKTPPSKQAPKSWADLVRRNAPTNAPGAAPNGAALTNGASLPKSASLADALKQYSVEHDRKLAFLEPRGLVNTGNMCYMNSILQVLVFCTPFYSFLDQVRQRTVYSMKSDTPLVDVLIMFLREFSVLASAESVEHLRGLLGQQQLEQYGEPFTPEYVYDAIRKLDRFSSMRRGHQQDAEEFLGFLLEGLHDECVKVMQSSSEEPQETGVTSPSAVMSPPSADGWLEVGPRQKASTTRTAGSQDAPTPVTKIFGGHLRSELRVPGLKDSVTLEPYKPLQLDIGAQHVNNIVDALKGLTRTESLTGDFGGRSNSAKKQVFIDTLPPVLVLHLKRFQYENNLTGTQKIWKKVGYPLELEIPKDVFPPSKRGGLAVKGGLPKYRLTSVVYHHGKSAAGGHYTVDVLREDGREWVRIDDTVIRRIRPEDVAEGGAEEDPKLLAKALEQHKADQDMQKQRNMYQGLDEADREPEEEKPWSEVNGNAAGGHGRKWSSVANTNGTATPASTTGKQTPKASAGAGAGRKEGVKDNKVAYILLYERMRG